MCVMCVQCTFATSHSSNSPKFGGRDVWCIIAMASKQLKFPGMISKSSTNVKPMRKKTVETFIGKKLLKMKDDN